MLANIITLSRVALVPVYLYFLFSESVTFRVIALAVFAFASFTDYLDGLAARKLKQMSEFGKFLDPLADKLLVIGALCGFLYYDSLIPVWMVLVIVFRDVLVTWIRSVSLRRGKSIRTMFLAKAKTAFQMITIILISIIFIIQPPVQFRGFVFPNSITIDNYGLPVIIDVSNYTARKLMMALQLTCSTTREGILLSLPYWLMLAITILTAVSGIRYVISDWKVFIPTEAKND